MNVGEGGVSKRGNNKKNKISSKLKNQAKQQNKSLPIRRAGRVDRLGKIQTAAQIVGRRRL